MATVRIDTTITITDDRSQSKIINISRTFTGLTALEERDYNLSADETRNLWDPTNVATEAMSDFDLFLAWSDGDVDLEFAADVDGTPSYDVKRVAQDVLFTLAADDTVRGTGEFGQVADVINRIRADEPGSTARMLKTIMAS